MRDPRLVLVPLLIDGKSCARTLNQSPGEVMQNQSNSLITFDTQLKTALSVTFTSAVSSGDWPLVGMPFKLSQGH